MIQVLIVEDVDSMRELLNRMVSSIEGARVSGTARGVADARAEILRHRPDVVLLDEVLPGESSLDLLRFLSEEGIPAWLISGSPSLGRPAAPGEALGRLKKPGWDTWEADQRRLSEAILQAAPRSR